MFRRLLLAAIPVLAAGCTITLDGEGVLVREERRFTVTGTPDLTLTTFDGSIDIRSWDRNEVVVEVEKRAVDEREANRLEVRASQEGNVIRIEVPAVSRTEVFGFGRSVNLRVFAPASVVLRAQTQDGSIVAEGLDGTIELRSGDGQVRLDRVTGQIRVNTGDGSISGVDLGGRAELSTGDGHIDIRGNFRVVRADTGDGSIDLAASEGSALEEDWTFTTGDGSIGVRLPPGFNAEIDAQSGDGSIEVNGESTQARAHGGPGDEDLSTLRTTLGTGGRTIRMRSGDGSIRLDSR